MFNLSHVALVSTLLVLCLASPTLPIGQEKNSTESKSGESAAEKGKNKVEQDVVKDDNSSK